MLNNVLNLISPSLRATVFFRFFSFLKIPLISFLAPRILEIDQSHCVVKLRLCRRSKNHLGSMYFGALATGADCAAGFLAHHIIRARGQNISLIFKAVEAQFLKRAEGDVFFSCGDGGRLNAVLHRAVESGKRVEETAEVIARVPSKFGDEPVAIFKLLMSFKLK